MPNSNEHMMDEDELPWVICCYLYCCSCIADYVVGVVKIIITLIVFVCVASLLVWIMFRSNAVKFQVRDAELTRFDYDLVNNNLYYSLSLNFSIRNSKSAIGILYDKFETIVSYSDQRLAAVSVPSFYQGHKTTKVLETVFSGQNLVMLGEHGRQRFEDDRKLGVYGIDVKVRIKSRVLFAHLVTWPMKPIVRCHLKVPLGSSNSTGGFNFKSTKCHVDF